MSRLRHVAAFVLVCAVIFLFASYRIWMITVETRIGIPTRDFIAVLVFAAAEAFILLRAFGYFYNVYRASGAVHPTPSLALAYAPAVTVLVPTAGESEELLRKTVTAASYMDYPRFRILLIDGNSDAEASPAARLAAERPDIIDYFFVPFPRHGAKAGAINEALKRIRSPYIAVLDADYRPGRNFLKRIIPRLEVDPGLAFIQTPQFYGNLASSIVSRAAQLQQAFFYEHISEGKGMGGAMFMCGTNLVIRTKDLREVGGFAEWSITEDFATSFEMTIHGKRGGYENVTAAYGEGPKNLDQYFRQQYRWARGTVGVFLRALPRLLNPRAPLTMGQRLEYLQSGAHYFIGFAWAIFVLFPILFLLFRIPAVFVDPRWAAAVYLSYLFVTAVFVFQSFGARQYRKFDWLFAEALTFIAIPVYIRACVDALLGRRATFHVTRKDGSPKTLPRGFVAGLAAFAAVSIFAAAVGIARAAVIPGEWLPVLVNLFWLGYHLMIAYTIPWQRYVSIHSGRRPLSRPVRA